MNEVVREFLLEAHESLAQLDLDLVTLERDPTERETLGRVFRTLHTIKGTAGFLGLLKLQSISHAGENLLARLRAGEIRFNPDIAGALLGVVDAVRQMLASLEASEDEGEGDYSALVLQLERLRSAAPALAAQGKAEPQGPATATAVAEPPPPTAPAPRPVPPAAAESVVNSPNPPTIMVAPAAPGTPADGPAEARAPAVADSAIRVDVGLLDKLMNLVGELVLARNQIMQFSTSQEDAGFLGTVQRFNLLTTELQASVMKTRMQPIGNIWSKFPRVVRDLAVACGKQVRIDMEGQDTELDKTIVEAIRDPLTHLVRNAVDHGIEPPEERVARGKAAEGRLSLHASHEGGKVIIEIADDGGGIDPQRVRAKAIHAKLVTPEQADRLNDRELVNLIFLPGFSTAERVTQFSGRGVGMDVVRTNVEKIGGTVDIDSRPGRGTTLRMKIPLTLAIIPALTVTSGGDRYCIPQVSLLELVRLEGEAAQRGIERMHGAPVYRLRGNLLPLVYLNRELQVSSAGVRDQGSGVRGQGSGVRGQESGVRSQESGVRSQEAGGRRQGSVASSLTPDPCLLTPDSAVNVVVLQADDRRFGLVVDAIHDTEEIVVKPLQKQLKGISAFAGATIMGDGRVALILDVLGLAQRAHVVAAVRERALTEKAAGAAGAADDRQTVLVFATHDGGRFAVPLALVARLEEFPRSAVERAGPTDVVQYRGEILPLLHVSRALRPPHRPVRHGRPGVRRQADAGETVQVVVYSGQGQRVGLVVGTILDIVEETLVSRSPAKRPGVLFTAVIQGRVTEFLDVEALISSAGPARAGV